MAGIRSTRTPDERFSDLPDFPYRPRYVELRGFDGLRLAYIDEGPTESGSVFLCLHGQPTWSFLYRKMIPPLLASSGRVVVPDLFGFGRSDKPVDDDVHTFDFHRDTLRTFVHQVDLRHVTLVVQDWGGLLGLTLLVDDSLGERFDRLIVMNTALATGKPLGAGFEAWRNYAASTDDLQVGRLLKRAQPDLTDAEAAAYDAPFPDKTYKAGVRKFPQLVMTSPDMPGIGVSRQTEEFLRTRWSGLTFMAVGALDPVFGAAHMRQLAASIRGCPPPLVLEDAGHFVQERGEVVVAAALTSFNEQRRGNTPAPAL